MIISCCIFYVPPVLVLNVTTKTDTIWSFSSHFTILSSSKASLEPESASRSSLSGYGASSLPAGVLEVAGVALQPSALETGLLVVGPPGTLLHPNPGAEHPGEARLLEGLDSRSFACAVDGAAPPGFSADGTSSQSSRGARSDRSTILSAVSPRIVNDASPNWHQVHPWIIPAQSNCRIEKLFSTVQNGCILHQMDVLRSSFHICVCNLSCLRLS